MGVFKNDVGRPSNKTIMIKTVLKVMGLIVIIAIAFGIGYYFNDKQKTILKVAVITVITVIKTRLLPLQKIHQISLIKNKLL